MMKKLKGLLNEAGYQLFTKKVDDVEYNYSFIRDRVYFISITGDIEPFSLKEFSNNMAINIAQLVKKDKYKEFFNNEIELTQGDTKIVTESLDLRAFLWDLYIINIHICEREKFFPSEIVSQVQRERLIARRIIIQEEKIEDALIKLVEEFSITSKLNEIVSRYREETGESSIIEKILDEGLLNGTKKKNTKKLEDLEWVPKENTLLKERIKPVKENNQTSINLHDIEKYLDTMKALYEEAKEYLKE